MLVFAQWRRKYFFLKVPNNLHPARRKETAELCYSGRNRIKFLQGKNHIDFPQRQDNRLRGCKRWSKPQVSSLRESSNIILSDTFMATAREICTFGANLAKKLCYLIERLYGVQISTRVSLKMSNTGIFHSKMQDNRECFLTAFLPHSRLEGLP